MWCAKVFLRVKDYVYGYSHKINTTHIVEIQCPYEEYCQIKLSTGDMIEVRCTEEEIDAIIEEYL